MIGVAKGHFSNITKFSEPWEFYIIDDFLPQGVYDSLMLLTEQDSSFLFVDETIVIDGEKTISSLETNEGNPKKKSILIKNNTYIQTNIKKVVENKLKDLIPDITYYVVPDIVRCDPGYEYPVHWDHPKKYISIVVFLAPIKANGTVLLDKKNNQYVVGWKQNRALIFKSGKGGRHFYVNTTNSKRFTLNVYITLTPDLSFNVYAPPK